MTPLKSMHPDDRRHTSVVAQLVDVSNSVGQGSEGTHSELRLDEEDRRVCKQEKASVCVK